MAFEKLLQRLGIDLERRVCGNLALNDTDDVGRDIFALLPMQLEPRLQLRHVARTLHLDVQFDVLREAGERKIAGANKCNGADDGDTRVRDVRLGVEFPLRIDAAFDLPFAQGFDDCGRAGKEVVRLLHVFRAGVERLGDAGNQAIEQCLPGALGNFVAH